MKLSLIKLYKDWIPVKDIFRNPSLHFYFGRWANDPCLPMWRRGPIIKVAKYSQYDYKGVGANWGNSTYWDSEFLSTCSKFGRLWRKFIKPTYQLPIWLMFKVINCSMVWKTKYGDYRYEFPPQFTIIFFGLSISFWLSAPKTNTSIGCDDDYWESILWYKELKTLKDTISSMGIITTYDKEIKKSYFALRPEYLQKEYQEEYYRIISELKKNRADKDEILY